MRLFNLISLILNLSPLMNITVQIASISDGEKLITDLLISEFEVKVNDVSFLRKTSAFFQRLFFSLSKPEVTSF